MDEVTITSPIIIRLVTQACVTSLIIIGLVMVTSSTVDFAATKFSNPLFFFKKQLLFIILGLFVLYIVTHIKIKFYYDYSCNHSKTLF